ncbi:hypothetical protein HNO89_001873 [Sporosarcina luteola]|nr:hypothetical protein [Sporosarcina luteola]
MKKYKKWALAFILLCSSIGVYYFSTTNSCMRNAPHYNSSLESDTNEYKRFKRTEEAMKEFGKYVPLPKDEPYLIQCTFGEVTYSADGEPVQFTHFVEYGEVALDVRKGAHWEYDKQLTNGMYYYRTSKEPFDYSLEAAELEDVKTIRLDDGVEALLLMDRLVEWKDDRFYYQLFYRGGFPSETALPYLANSSRLNISNVPVWVNEIQ